MKYEFFVNKDGSTYAYGENGLYGIFDRWEDFIYALYQKSPSMINDDLIKATENGKVVWQETWYNLTKAFTLLFMSFERFKENWRQFYIADVQLTGKLNPMQLETLLNDYPELKLEILNKNV